MSSTLPPTIKTGKLPALAHSSHPAGFFSRSLAFIIDLALIGIIPLVGSLFLQTLIRFFKLTGLVDVVINYFEQTSVQIGSGAVLTTLFVIGYYTFFWTLVGFTPGKALMGLKVVRKNGAKLSFGRSLLRFFSYWISAIPIFLGYFWILWDRDRQAWHDKIAGSQVMYIPKKPLK